MDGVLAAGTSINHRRLPLTGPRTAAAAAVTAAKRLIAFITGRVERQREIELRPMSPWRSQGRWREGGGGWG